MKHDVLDVIEAAYRFETDTVDWLRGIVAAAYPQIGDGLGALSFCYRVTPDLKMEVREGVQVDMPMDMLEPSRAALSMLPPEFVRKSFVRCECATQSQAADAEMKEQLQGMMDAAAENFGWRDIVMLGGMDPTGHGVYLGAWLGRTTRLSPRQRARWNRVAVHLVSAYRLRRRLSANEARETDTADAVLTPAGVVSHAQGEAESREARTALRDAVRGMERARGGLRHRDQDAAVDAWKGLVSVRWSLVDHFESDGRRYVLARRNDPSLGGFESLTDRERQAVGWASLGHSNKLIAYEMGVSASTVGVLLHRAARKFGAKTRTALVSAYLERTAPDATG